MPRVWSRGADRFLGARVNSKLIGYGFLTGLPLVFVRMVALRFALSFDVMLGGEIFVALLGIAGTAVVFVFVTYAVFVLVPRMFALAFAVRTFVFVDVSPHAAANTAADAIISTFNLLMLPSFISRDYR